MHFFKESVANKRRLRRPFNYFLLQKVVNSCFAKETQGACGQKAYFGTPSINYKCIWTDLYAELYIITKSERGQINYSLTI